MKIKTLLIFLIGISLKGSAAPPDWAAVHSLTTHGLHQLYSLEIDSAKQTFRPVGSMAPTDPRGPFFLSMAHFYMYGLNRDENELSMFFNTSEKAIERCENLLEDNENDADVKFYLGGIYGYRGLAYQSSGSVLKAARDGRKGYLCLVKTLSALKTAN